MLSGAKVGNGVAVGAGVAVATGTGVATCACAPAKKATKPTITGFSGLIHLSPSELLGRKPDMAVTLPIQGSLEQAENCLIRFAGASHNSELTALLKSPLCSCVSITLPAES